MKNKFKITNDFWIGLACLAVSIAFLVMSHTYPNLNRDAFDAYGADGFPLLISRVMIFFSLMLIVESIIKGVKIAKNPQTAVGAGKDQQTPEEKKAARNDVLRVLAIIAICIVYFLLVKKIGFVICTPILMFCCMAIYGNKKWCLIFFIYFPF